MAVAYDSSSTAFGASGTGGSVSINRPGAATIGDTLWLGVKVFESGTVTTPTGWTLVNDQANGSDRIYLFTKQIAASEPSSYSVTVSTRRSVLGMIQLTGSSGAGNTSKDVGTAANPSVCDLPSVSVSNDDSMGVYVCGLRAGFSTTCTIPAGATTRIATVYTDGSSNRFWMITEPLDSGTTGTKTVSPANVLSYQAVAVLAISEASGGGGGSGGAAVQYYRRVTGL